MDEKARFQDASAKFVNSNFVECEETLSKVLPGPHDSKLAHNKAVCSYSSKGGDVQQVLQDLHYTPELKVLDDSKLCLEYEGQDIALMNQAIFLMHNGEHEKAASLLLPLAQSSTRPLVKGRVAALLHLCTAGNNKSGAQGVILKLISEMQADQTDQSVVRMTKIALADQSALESLFSGSTKTALDFALFHNNIGVDVAKRNRHQIAALHFTLSLKSWCESGASDDLVMECILYNIALSFLLTNTADQLEEVVTLLLGCQRSMIGSGTMWLRVAQTASTLLLDVSAGSCIDAFRKRQVRLHDAIKETGSIPTPIHLIGIPESAEVIPAANAQQLRWVEIGSCAAKNSILLLPSNPENFGLLQTAWLQAAFFASIQRNYSVALRYCNDLITAYQKQHSNKQTLASVPAQRRISNDSVLTAVAYALEAYCFVNRPGAAVRLLQSISLGELLSGGDGIPGGRKQGVESLFVNLCIVHIANGSFKHAQAIAATVLSRLAPSPSQSLTPAAKCAFLLQTVLELAQGNVDKASELLSKTPILPPLFR
jgi:hypothetical protein